MGSEDLGSLNRVQALPSRWVRKRQSERNHFGLVSNSLLAANSAAADAEVAAAVGNADAIGVEFFLPPGGARRRSMTAR